MENLNQNEFSNKPQTVKKFPTWLIVLFSILITGAAVAFGTFYFLEKQKLPSLPNQQNQSTVPIQNEEEISSNFVYMKSLTDSVQGQAEIIISNFDGSNKSTIQAIPKYVGPLSNGNDISQNGKIVYTTLSDNEEKIWISDKGAPPKNIFIALNGKSVESTKISLDGEKIAYSLITWNINPITHIANNTEQLWIMNSDGSDNKMIIDNTRQYIVDQGPFRLIPLAWSIDKTKIYMITTTDSEATPRGMYIADLATSKIEKAKTPNVTLWDLSFSPDRTKIAYSAFEWKFVPDSLPLPGAPYKINVTDLNTGSTETIIENQVERYSNPVWSPDGKKLIFKIGKEIIEGGDSGIFLIDIPAKKTSLIVSATKNTRLIPWIWVSNERIIYTEETYTTGLGVTKVNSYIFSIKIDTKDKKKIDTAKDIMVFNSL